MARIRTIKPEFWTDSFMVQLPPLARLIYISLWTAADDHGLISDEPERLAMEVMPREDGLTFDDWFQFFETTGRVERFVAPDGSTYFRIAKWEVHQRVDKPGKSRIYREDSRKVAIPLEVRRKVASKYKCAPGETVDANCFYCGAPGQVHWHKLSSGRPSNWVTFPGLELDHALAECGGGEATVENIVLACRGCNRSKRDRDWLEFLYSVNLREIPEGLATPREDSGTDQGSGIREQGMEGKGSGNRELEEDVPSPVHYSPGFLAVWKAYPHHGQRSKKKAAFTVWSRSGLETQTDSVLSWVESAQTTHDWIKEGGRFIPAMQVWLKDQDFSDPPPTTSADPISKLSPAGQQTAAALRRVVARREAEEMAR